MTFNTAMGLEVGKWRVLRSPLAILVIVILIVFSGSAVYAVMSDVSIHGLTVKTYGVSRSCASSQLITFSISNAVVWSTASLRTSLTHVTFILNVDGASVGSSIGADTSFGPGQSVTYSLTFRNATVDPHSLPASSHLTLSITALATAGLYSSYVTSSDSQTEAFGAQSC
jgi:hypothetical protein